MSLTRKLLKEMNLEESQIEQIIQAHVETVEALKTQITAAQADSAQIEALTAERDLLLEKINELSSLSDEAQRIQAEFDAYKAQEQAALSQQEKQQLIHNALLNSGANEKAVLLLAREIRQEDMVIENGALRNAEELIAPVRAKYAAFFAQPLRMPAPVIQPPATLHGALTRQDVARMTPEEINANWDAVRSVLAQH